MKPKRYFRIEHIYRTEYPLTAVYFLLSRGRIVYIGQTNNVYARVMAHKRNGLIFDSVRPIECLDKDKRREYETRWLNKFKPIYNKQIPLNGTWVSMSLRIDRRIYRDLKNRAKASNRSVNGQIVDDIELRNASSQRTVTSSSAQTVYIDAPQA